MNKILMPAALLLAALSTAACGNTKKIAEKSASRLCVAIDLLESSPDSLRVDHFTIDSLAIADDCLEVYVSYGGGCGDVSFNLYRTMLVQNSFPPQTNLYFSFEDNDHCRAIERKKLVFSLKPFREYADTGGIWFNVAGGGGQRILYQKVE